MSDRFRTCLHVKVLSILCASGTSYFLTLKSKKKATRSALSCDVKHELRSVHFDSDVKINSASEDELVSGTDHSFKQKPTFSFIKLLRMTSLLLMMIPFVPAGFNAHLTVMLLPTACRVLQKTKVISSNLNTLPAPLELQSTKFIAATLNFQAAEFKFNANLVKTYATHACIAKVIADEACSILKSCQDSGSDSSAFDASFATAQSISTTGSEDTVVTPTEVAVPVIKTVECHHSVYSWCYSYDGRQRTRLYLDYTGAAED
ncbi:hypothetical protein EV368DRAFT_66588 [Lentinula lateritia]|nr:hypothetical protein EV368DRAFT_66588 [Lentinula lateritia]